MVEDQRVEVMTYKIAFKLFGTPDSLKLLRTLGIPKTQFLSSVKKSEISKCVEIKIIGFLKSTGVNF